MHGLSAIAALTAQHTRGVTAVHVPPVDFLRAQIDACFEDFAIGAVKLGMLANAEVIHAVADALERHRPTHVVLDPVMVATSGARLLEPTTRSTRCARGCCRWRRWSRRTCRRPSCCSAMPSPTAAMREARCATLRELGARAVLLKGGHLQTTVT